MGVWGEQVALTWKGFIDCKVQCTCRVLVPGLLGRCFCEQDPPVALLHLEVPSHLVPVCPPCPVTAELRRTRDAPARAHVGVGRGGWTANPDCKIREGENPGSHLQLFKCGLT